MFIQTDTAELCKYLCVLYSRFDSGKQLRTGKVQSSRFYYARNLSISLAK